MAKSDKRAEKISKDKNDRINLEYYGKKYMPLFGDIHSLLLKESNPQMIHLIIKDCMSTAEDALDQLKHIPEVSSKEAVQRFLDKYEKVIKK